MNEKLLELIESLDVNEIPDDRKTMLLALREFIKIKKYNNRPIILNFICTHNSRRSHLAQIWANTMAEYFGIKIHSYSGGTEATEVYPQIFVTLVEHGFHPVQFSNEKNPVIGLKSGPSALPLISFSKRFDHPINPENSFAAIMVCDQAEANCPFVPGAEKRISITYQDPKAYDNSAEKEEKYLESSLQIATEMKYVFSEIH